MRKKKPELLFEWECIFVKWNQLLLECLGHTTLNPKETEVGILDTGRMFPICIPKNVGFFYAFFSVNPVKYCTMCAYGCYRV